MYTEIVESILKSSGWSPSRHVTVSHWVLQLESEGFTMLPKAVKVLEAFGGLTIMPIVTSEDEFSKGLFRFDPVWAASGEFDRVDYWQNLLQIKLSPLAEGSGGEILLLADDDRVFSCIDQMIYLEGRSFKDALENTLIVAKRRSIEIGRMC